MSEGGSDFFWHQLGATAVSHAPRYWTMVVVAAMLAIAISDIVWRKVSNKVVAFSWLLGCGLMAHESGLLGLEGALVASLTCFALAIVPYAFGLIGAADVKVFSALGALVGPGAVVSLLLYAAFFAGLLGIVALLHRSSFSVSQMAIACLNPQGALDRARKSGQTMPLTVALCSGAYLILWGGASWLL